MKLLNDKEIREFLVKHSAHKTDFVKVDKKTKLKCFDCNLIIDVKVATSRVDILDKAEDKIEEIFRSIGF